MALCGRSRGRIQPPARDLRRGRPAVPQLCHLWPSLAFISCLPRAAPPLLAPQNSAWWIASAPDWSTYCLGNGFLRQLRGRADCRAIITTRMPRRRSTIRWSTYHGSTGRGHASASMSQPSGWTPVCHGRHRQGPRRSQGARRRRLPPADPAQARHDGTVSLCLRRRGRQLSLCAGPVARLRHHRPQWLPSGRRQGP